jgi:hypothetical protein
MMASMPRGPLALAALAMLAGSQSCSSGDTSIDTFVAKFPTAFCTAVYRCCSPGDATRFFPYGMPDRGVDDCTQLLHDRTARYREVMQMQLAPITYDGVLAARCLERLAALTCADLVKARTEELPALECDSVFRIQGHQPLGARCLQPYDCAEGLACLQPAHDTPGVCRTLAEVPGACPASCPAHAFCNTTTDHLCVMGAAEGAGCRFDDECASKVCMGANRAASQPGTCGFPAGACAQQP